MITPEQSKDFVMNLQVYITNIIKKEFGETSRSSITTAEALDIANDIVDYCFCLMLMTHRGEKIQSIVDDDIPF